MCMSGGGRGIDWTDVGRPTSPGGGDGGGGGGPDADPCDIVSLTNLNSPDAAVVGTLRPGDVLEVRLRAGPPRLLLAETGAGRIVGSITSAAMPRIIACIQKGETYVADVVTVRGGICQVRIHR